MKDRLPACESLRRLSTDHVAGICRRLATEFVHAELSREVPPTWRYAGHARRRGELIVLQSGNARSPAIAVIATENALLRAEHRPRLPVFFIPFLPARLRPDIEYVALADSRAVILAAAYVLPLIVGASSFPLAPLTDWQRYLEMRRHNPDYMVTQYLREA